MSWVGYFLNLLTKKIKKSHFKLVFIKYNLILHSHKDEWLALKRAIEDEKSWLFVISIQYQVSSYKNTGYCISQKETCGGEHLSVFISSWFGKCALIVQALKLCWNDTWIKHLGQQTRHKCKRRIHSLNLSNRNETTGTRQITNKVKAIYHKRVMI